MLAVDTCGAEGGVAVARDGEVVARRSLPGRETQERLMTAVQECLAEAGIRATELNFLAVMTGPGSFTGVRIGVAAVKGLAEGLGIPVVGVSRLNLMTRLAGEGAVAWLDAGRGDVYAGGSGLPEAMFSRAEAEAMGGRVVVGEEVLRGAGEWVGLPDISTLVRAAEESAARGEFSDVVLLDANYLRIPDAEIALRARS
ncbi:peptidase M22 glycoprotease [Terriglobus saanensis SP1PR4]|uniref:Peptidase M22 glycoprotease n=2 Tax=Terriglobus saanensis TaxID=870903 RepID=E8V7S7_TERSS|nr:peptidase M22 glycoprotease [Terriglobus saanensis SP1PR4]